MKQTPKKSGTTRKSASTHRRSSPQQSERNKNVQNTRTRRKPRPVDSMSGGEPIEILLVEDNDYDAQRTMDALKTGKIRNRVSWVEDGVEAMTFLRRQGAHASAPRPD